MNPQSLSRLRGAITWSERRLRDFREQKLSALKQFVGFHYGGEHAVDKVPINLIELGVSVYQRRIASHMPQTLVLPKRRELWPTAADMEVVVNQRIRQLDLDQSLNLCGVEAMFAMGVMKVGLDGEGKSFAQPVLFEDLLLDMKAKSWRELRYIGDRFTVPLEWAKYNPAFDERAREKLGSHSKELLGDRSETRSESLSQGSGGIASEDFEDTVDLIEVYMPLEGLVITMEADGEGTPLNVVRWQGPRRGPYHTLMFERVPGNLIPLAPVALWMDLHSITNVLFNKASRQAQRQKTFTAVQGHAKDDGARLVDINDGEAHLFEHPDGIQEIRMGGADQGTLGTAMWAKQMLDFMAGNLSSLGGLAPQSGTATQDQLIAASANQRVADMQQEMLRFTKGIIEDIAWYEWDDPLSEQQIERPIPGTDFTIPSQWTPETRQGEFADFGFDIAPFSMQNQTPEERINRITGFLTNVLLPSLPFMQAAGIGIDWERFLRLFGKMTNLVELQELIVYANGETVGANFGQPAGMPSATTRTNVRENRSSGSGPGQERAIMSMLMGGGSGAGGSMTAPAA